MKQTTSSATAVSVTYRTASLERIEPTQPAVAPVAGVCETVPSSDLRYRAPRGVARTALVGIYRMLRNGLLLSAQATLFSIVVVGYLLATCILFPWRRFRRRWNTK